MPGNACNYMEFLYEVANIYERDVSKYFPFDTLNGTLANILEPMHVQNFIMGELIVNFDFRENQISIVLKITSTKLLSTSRI